ncbi:MAG: glycosyltransferase family 2 protein [Gemmatimonadota bacterium]|nr:glycosyltransferase family 2 protein [Gemmatimonadota bacterium]
MEMLRGSATLYILLSAYNGAKYIAEQIESIRAQSLTDWVLIVRDDGSADSTVRVVKELTRMDGRVRLLRDGRGNLGPVASFGALLESASARGAAYVALSDQDDVWKADKLERQLALLMAHEAAVGLDHPTLVHSDLAVVSDDLQPIHPSYLRRQRLEHLAVDPLRRLLVQNFVTGCTAVFNGALLRAVIPVPRVVMHDWWLAQCAAATGSILFVEEATVLYRQHAANVLGSRGALRMYADALRRPADQWERDAHHLAASREQACILATRLRELPSGSRVDARKLELVGGFCEALRDGRSPLGQLRAVRRLGVRPRSLTYPLFFYLRILCGVPSGSESSRQL